MGINVQFCRGGVAFLLICCYPYEKSRSIHLHKNDTNDISSKLEQRDCPHMRIVEIADLSVCFVLSWQWILGTMNW